MKTTDISSPIVPMKLANLLLALFAIMILTSCNNDDELLLEATLLQGTWVETEPENLIQFAGDNHTFTFNEEGFLLKLHSWTDVIHEDEQGNLTEIDQYKYGKGEYFINENTITFNGVLGLDSDFSEPDDTSKLEPFQLSYDYRVNSKNTIVLNPQSEFESITLVKE